MSQVEEPANRDARAAARAIDADRAAIAAALVQREFERRPELLQRYGEAGQEKSRRDAEYHLAFLAEALRMESVQLFVQYVGWSKVVLASRGVDSQVFAFHLECMRDVLNGALPPVLSGLACRAVERALRELPQLPSHVPEFITEGQRFYRLARSYLDALLTWDRALASQLIFDAVEHAVTLEELYLHVFECAQREVGRLWQTNRVSVAQEHYCSAVTQMIMAQLYPKVFATSRHGGTMVATAVCGDMHEIGVRMIADVFELHGWNTHYLGANVPNDGVVQVVNGRQADVLAISATLAYHVSSVEQLIAAVRQSAVGAKIKILVGGYAFNLDPRLWRKLGADGYAMDLVAAASWSERFSRVRISV